VKLPCAARARNTTYLAMLARVGLEARFFLASVRGCESFPALWPPLYQESARGVTRGDTGGPCLTQGVCLASLPCVVERPRCLALPGHGGSTRAFAGRLYAVYDTGAQPPYGFHASVLSRLMMGGGGALLSSGTAITVHERCCRERQKEAQLFAQSLYEWYQSLYEW